MRTAWSSRHRVWWGWSSDLSTKVCTFPTIFETLVSSLCVTFAVG
ncbi:expressed unknown protein [Ectocarpus siliculosus]|uniref:Uncharacterized protein n=1 Tax=Ectocarpus siliculosus TaxID=2880 RepID=D7G4E1_ECTSI|nr:expressed unknown protein [Ectocarpus siliculosus]|eukprot:CBJ33687.1 expressed unknown protein [Ectocarpus siliculosus]